MKAPAIMSLTAALALPLLAVQPPPAARATSPCTFGRGSPVPAGSVWMDQFKCYQSSGRHVTIVGSGAFDAGVVSGGVCLLGVTPDRIQVAPCGTFGGDGAMTLAYTAIAYLVDEPGSQPVRIYVTALFRG